jgi:hypothetical protein
VSLNRMLLWSCLSRGELSRGELSQQAVAVEPVPYKAMVRCFAEGGEAMLPASSKYLILNETQALDYTSADCMNSNVPLRTFAKAPPVRLPHGEWLKVRHAYLDLMAEARESETDLRKEVEDKEVRE